jgi:hypothetical protein
LQTTTLDKGGFFSESAIRFSNLQTKIFQVQDSFFGIFFFGDLKKSHL